MTYVDGTAGTNGVAGHFGRELRRFWDRDRPVMAAFVVDEFALYRQVG
jgi:hypothetical protein